MSGFKFPADLMNEVMRGLCWSVVNMLKDCNKARVAVTTYSAFGNVVEGGNAFCDNNDCKDAVKFTVYPLLLDIVWDCVQPPGADGN
jgi:hypothetical protein